MQNNLVFGVEVNTEAY